MYQQAKGKYSLRSQHQDSPCIARAHRRWQKAKEKRASLAGERQQQHRSGIRQRKPSQAKDESKNTFPDFFFFFFFPNGRLGM